MGKTHRALLAKILVTIGVTAFALRPFIFEDGAEGYYGHIIALPVLLFALWSRLHGSGRSIRLVAFLGLAYCIGIWISGSAQDFWYEIPIFLALTLGILLSIRRGANPIENENYR